MPPYMALPRIHPRGGDRPPYQAWPTLYYRDNGFGSPSVQLMATMTPSPSRLLDHGVCGRIYEGSLPALPLTASTHRASTRHLADLHHPHRPMYNRYRRLPLLPLLLLPLHIMPPHRPTRGIRPLRCLDNS